jgi:hypothetical protein
VPSKSEVERQRDEYRAKLEDAYDLLADALGYDAVDDGEVDDDAENDSQEE